MKKLLTLLLIIWELPQNILGYTMSRLWKKRLIILSQKELSYLYGLEEIAGFKIYVADYYSQKSDKVLGKLSGFSLGKYICMNSAHDLTTLRHEKGHSKQSKTLGWLYLPMVGIYSAVFCNLWNKLFHKNWNKYDKQYWYYKTRWTERQADKYGNVKRDNELCKLERPVNSIYPAIAANMFDLRNYAQ